MHPANYISESIDINNDNNSGNNYIGENIDIYNDINSDNNSEGNYFIEDKLNDITDDNIALNETSNFKEQLKQWVFEYNITHRATGALLKLLKNVNNNTKLQDLPLDPRTLLETPKHIVVREVPPRKYFHYGLKNALIDILKTVRLSTISKNIEININIDGLPLTKNSKSQFYPILGEIYPKNFEPFVIGVYHGYNKPACSNVFLQDFIEEYILLHEKGFEFNEIHFTVAI
ncbi:uncharacterized protein LOC143902145 [Temnothorax americanus]|uniref:uncharacterized protein LOC143902145 n=1 Tax=Temnothorax americanus TaxID=1964332 RepID=UPI0040694F41